jgi:hypothetical protein
VSSVGGSTIETGEATMVSMPRATSSESGGVSGHSVE